MTLTLRLTLVLSLLTTVAYGQLQEYPLPQTTAKTTTQRGASATPLGLPFWDDFSTSGPAPDTALWENSAAVYVNAGLGIDPLTLNVATFDGVDADGKSYSNQNLAYGPTDVLTSCVIDLSDAAAVTYADPNDTETYRNSLYVSWYWQLQGNGERPDGEDSLRMEFLDAGGEWQEIWSVNGATNLGTKSTWQFANAQVPFAYWHDLFQFRFSASSRQTGNFDSWHLDYVYMDVGRTSTDSTSVDRAITGIPGSIFGDYSAIPRYQYDQETGAALARIQNLTYDSPYPVRLRATLDDLNAGTQIQELQDDNQLIRSSHVLTIDINPPNGDLIANALEASPDTALHLRLNVRVTTQDTLLTTLDPVTGDTSYSNVSLAVNDTVSRRFVLDNYFAYDDGTADYVAGMGSTGGIVVYQYVLSRPDTLTHFDIYFPAVKGNNTTPPLELLVMKNPDSNTESILSQSIVTLQPAATINTFTRYPLASAVAVSDTIYIGWRQQTSAFIGVGLDKSSDSGSKIWSSVRGTWSQNELVRGNLMMRPVFDTLSEPVVSAVPEVQAMQVLIYPNPARHSVTVEGEISYLQVVDVLGRGVEVSAWQRTPQQWELDVRGLPTGMYYIRVQNRAGQTGLEKLLITD